MSRDTSNNELEQEIDRYLKGHLTEKEAQKLWAKLLKQPEYIDRLQTQIDLTRYHSQIQSKTADYRQYWRWAAAAAAVVLIVAGINLFSNETLNDYTIDAIFLQDNLATATVIRSDDPNFEHVDSLLNLGFGNAMKGHIDEALMIYNKIAGQYPETAYATKAYLNTGILTYNKGNYKQSVESFKKVLSNTHKNDFIREQAYWYLANALINVGKVKQAEKALQRAYRLNGIHRLDIVRLLDKLDEANR